MNFKKNWLKMALLFAMAAVIGFAIPTTIAYIVEQSNSVINLFDAPYFPAEQGGVNIQIQKIITSMADDTITPQGFQFLLQNAENPDENYTMTADAKGNASLRLVFADEDLGKTYTYQLSEINGGDKNVIYSDVVYEIRITPQANGENQVEPLVAVNGQEVEDILLQFENIYSPVEPPDTGDHLPLIIFAALLMISAAGLVLLMKKRRAMQ
ncbi:MAG: LPXTG cell wall anchor domain-containing protein [Clostridiales bacterium]|nr:LPXTG cell wall anchor domain-containing protein [Clostridiales bacterium]